MYHFHEIVCLLQDAVGCGVIYLHPKLQVRKVWQSQAVWFTVDLYPEVMARFGIRAAEERGYWELMGGNQCLSNSVGGVSNGPEHTEHRYPVKTITLCLLTSLLGNAVSFPSCLEFLGTCCLQPFLQLTQKSPTSQMSSILWAAEGLHEFEKLRIWERQHNIAKLCLYC